MKVSVFKDLAGKIGLNWTIAFTLFTRAIQAAGGVISIVFIARFLTRDEQGYFYTFASILAIQVFFELGLSGIITQYTAHEFAYLKWENNEVTGEDYYKSRLSSLLRFCIKWFGVISVMLFFLLLACGFYFFSSYNKGLGVKWQNPWILLCLATSLNLFIDPVLAFIDGLGDVKDMAKVRLIQKSVYIISLFLFFLLGFGLYSSALASILSIGINYLQIIFTKRKDKIMAIWKLKGEWNVNYMGEIFPVQWRIALSWMSGYFIFQLFNPVLFAFSGPAAAGQMGISMQVLGGISNLSMSWITTKIPLISSLIAVKNYSELNAVFNKSLKSLLIVCTLMVSAFFLCYLGLYYFKISYYNRFLPPLPLAMLCVVTIINQLIFSWATYLRSHKKEPFLVNSIVIGILVAASTFIFGKYWGVTGLVSGYAFIAVVISLPWAYYIFKTKKIDWHGS